MKRRDFLLGTAALAASPIVAAGAAAQPGTKPSASASTGVSQGLRLLVLGGTRFLGPTVVRAALAGGHEVTIFNRGQSNSWLFPGVNRLAGNRFPEVSPGLDSLKEGRWDAVIDISAQYPRHVEASARALSDRTDHYILMSSIAVYGDYRRGGIDEDSPVMEHPVQFRELPDLYETDWHHYGVRKVLCERAVREVYTDRCAIVRAGQLIGQSLGGANRSDGRWYWQARFRRDRVVGAPGDGTDPVQPVDIRDLADFLLNLASGKTSGTYNVVGPSIPFGAFVRTARDVVRSNSEIRWFGAEKSRRILNVPYFTPFATLPGFGTIANGRATRSGMRFRPIEESIRTDWQFFLENLPSNYDFAANGTGLTAEQEAALIRPA